MHVEVKCLAQEHILAYNPESSDPETKINLGYMIK